MIGSAGVVAGVALLIVFALRGTNMIVASLLCATLVAVANGLSPMQSVTTDYIAEMTRFSGPFFLLFVTGAAFGRMMAESHAATAIALALARAMGAQRTLPIATIVCAVLTYGGVNVFVVVFTVYPIGLGLMRQSGIPKRLFMAACALGSGTFTMTALPGTPSFQNIVAARAMNTPLTAAPGLGLLAGLVMLALGLAYLEFERRRAAARGERFQPGPRDLAPPAEGELRMPHWLRAAVPMGVVLVTIIGPLVLHIVRPAAEGDTSLYAQVLGLATKNPLNWTVVALAGGTLAGFVVLRPWLSQPLVTLGHGAESAISPLFNTAAIIGFGGVVKATPAFAFFAGLMLESPLPPLVSASIAINVLAGVMGSATGALQIFATSLAPQYLAQGVDPAVLHRVVAVASGGLDSLPHSGAIITTLMIMGLTHREAYKDTGVVTVVIPLMATVVLVAAASLA